MKHQRGPWYGDLDVCYSGALHEGDVIKSLELEDPLIAYSWQPHFPGVIVVVVAQFFFLT